MATLFASCRSQQPARQLEQRRTPTAPIAASISSARPRTAEPPASASPSPWIGMAVDTGRVETKFCFLESVSFETRTRGTAIDACGSWFRTEDAGLTFVPVVANDAEAPPEGGRKVTWSQRALRIFDEEKLVRATPIVVKGPGGVEPIRGVVSLKQDWAEGRDWDAELAGWTDHALVSSLDGGRTWFARSLLSEGIIRSAFHVHPDSVVLETTDGRIMTAYEAKDIEPSRQPEFDKFDLDSVAAHHLGRRPPPSPLSCLQRSGKRMLQLTVGKWGCFHKNEQTLHLEWSGQTVTVTLENGAPVHLPNQDVQPLIEAIILGLNSPEDTGRYCTNQAVASLEWQCNSTELTKASFSESDCAETNAPPPAGRAHRVQAAIQGWLTSQTELSAQAMPSGSP